MCSQYTNTYITVLILPCDVNKRTDHISIVLPRKERGMRVFCDKLNILIQKGLHTVAIWGIHPRELRYFIWMESRSLSAAF